MLKRISADREDPDFIGEKNFGRYVALLNGERVENCVVASLEQGYVIRHKTDADGKLVLNHAGDDVERETLHGKVEVFDTRTSRVL